MLLYVCQYIFFFSNNKVKIKKRFVQVAILSVFVIRSSLFAWHICMYVCTQQTHVFVFCTLTHVSPSYPVPFSCNFSFFLISTANSSWNIYLLTNVSLIRVGKEISIRKSENKTKTTTILTTVELSIVVTTLPCRNGSTWI